VVNKNAVAGFEPAASQAGFYDEAGRLVPGNHSLVSFGAFAKVQQSLAAVTDTGRSLWSNYFALRGAAKENEALKRRNLELEAQLQQVQALANTTHALEEALALSKSMPQPTLAGLMQPGSAGGW